MSLKNIMNKKIITISKDASVKDAAQKMYHAHVGSIVVVEISPNLSERPVGILTDRDIVLALGKSESQDLNREVKYFMTKNLLMCSVDDSLSETINKMKINGVRRIPVVDSKNNLKGIISADNILQLLGEEISALSLIINSETNKEQNLDQKIRPDHQLV